MGMLGPAQAGMPMKLGNEGAQGFIKKAAMQRGATFDAEGRVTTPGAPGPSPTAGDVTGATPPRKKKAVIGSLVTSPDTVSGTTLLTA